MRKAVWFLAGTLVVVTTVLVVVLNVTTLSLRVAFADDQTRTFEEMHARASRGNPEEAAGCLEYTVMYYPSGTKQVAGSDLDRIVERARKEAIQGIISELRAKTGKDFGDDPQPWIDEFRQKLRPLE